MRHQRGHVAAVLFDRERHRTGIERHHRRAEQVLEIARRRDGRGHRAGRPGERRRRRRRVAEPLDGFGQPLARGRRAGGVQREAGRHHDGRRIALVHEPGDVRRARFDRHEVNRRRHVVRVQRRFPIEISGADRRLCDDAVGIDRSNLHRGELEEVRVRARVGPGGTAGYIDLDAGDPAAHMRGNGANRIRPRRTLIERHGCVGDHEEHGRRRASERIQPRVERGPLSARTFAFERRPRDDQPGERADVRRLDARRRERGREDRGIAQPLVDTGAGDTRSRRRLRERGRGQHGAREAQHRRARARHPSPASPTSAPRGTNDPSRKMVSSRARNPASLK